MSRADGRGRPPERGETQTAKRAVREIRRSQSVVVSVTREEPARGTCRANINIRRRGQPAKRVSKASVPVTGVVCADVRVAMPVCRTCFRHEQSVKKSKAAKLKAQMVRINRKREECKANWVSELKFPRGGPEEGQRFYYNMVTGLCGSAASGDGALCMTRHPHLRRCGRSVGLSRATVERTNA